jgi:hypothetical protein
VSIEVSNDFLGLALKEVKSSDGTLVSIQNIKSDADPLLKQALRPDMILIGIGDVKVEGYSGKDIINLFKSESKPTKLIFRDPSMFLKKLDSTLSLNNIDTTNVSVVATLDSILETTINPFLNETLRVERTKVSHDKSWHWS